MAEGMSLLHEYLQRNPLTRDSFVEYETSADLRNAVDKLDGREFKGQAVRCIADVWSPES